MRRPALLALAAAFALTLPTVGGADPGTFYDKPTGDETVQDLVDHWNATREGPGIVYFELVYSNPAGKLSLAAEQVRLVSGRAPLSIPNHELGGKVVFRDLYGNDLWAGNYAPIVPMATATADSRLRFHLPYVPGTTDIFLDDGESGLSVKIAVPAMDEITPTKGG